MSDSEPDAVAHTTFSVEKKQSACRDKSHTSDMTAQQRLDSASHNRKCFYVERDLLYCKACEKSLDHSRQDSLDKHIIGKKHKDRANKLAPNAKRQRTLLTTFPVPNPARLANLTLMQDFIKALTAAKIPLNAVNIPEFRNFLRTHVKSGGAIPESNGLKPYLEDTFKVMTNQLKVLLACKNIVITFYETFEKDGRYVCCVLFTIISIDFKLTPILADTHFESVALTGIEYHWKFLEPRNHIFSMKYSVPMQMS